MGIEHRFLHGGGSKFNFTRQDRMRRLTERRGSASNVTSPDQREKRKTNIRHELTGSLVCRNSQVPGKNGEGRL